jgi:hypothetical protein
MYEEMYEKNIDLVIRNGTRCSLQARDIDDFEENIVRVVRNGTSLMKTIIRQLTH